MEIIGAGLAGCLAGIANGSATIFEKKTAINRNHDALLRFTTPRISELTGIPFKKVHVTKGIFIDGRFVNPDPGINNQYAQKVINKYVSRSIVDIAPVDRWIAPANFHEQLIDMLGNRIIFDMDPILRTTKAPTISTIPLPELLKKLNIAAPEFKFNNNHIFIIRGTINNCDLNQSVYFPGKETSIYRASIVGDEIIAEGISEISCDDWEYMLGALHIDAGDIRCTYNSQQQYGKIDPLPTQDRQRLLHQISSTTNIWCLGRFATWRNVMLDEVYDDIFAIRKMINNNPYQIAKEYNNES